MVVLTKVIIVTTMSSETPTKMVYLVVDCQDDLFSKITLPPLHADVEMVMAKDFHFQEIHLGKPTKDTTKALNTI